MQMNIDACEVDATHKVLYHVYTVGNDEDVLSANVIHGYMERLIDGSVFIGSLPDESVETPFFRVFLTVTNTHRGMSRIACEYKRLNADGRFNSAVENIHETVYQVIKGNVRRGMLEYRAIKAAKEERRLKAERDARSARTGTEMAANAALEQGGIQDRGNVI